MNDDLISRSELKNHKFLSPDNLDYSRYHDNVTKDYQQGWNDAIDAIIDNAPTVEYPKQITIKCDTEEAKQQLLSEFRNAKLNMLVEEERPYSEWVRKEDVIHSIAKQYSEHNELVPIWLSIGDLKGGADMRKEEV